jgi:hypothetical protein
VNLVLDSGKFYLEEYGHRVELTPREVNLFRQMNPMGRRLTLRKRALENLRANPDDPETKLILELTRLPASEWKFIVPEAKINEPPG